MPAALEFEKKSVTPRLERRLEAGSLRTLVPYHIESCVDFSSNDYLGLAQTREQHEKVENAYRNLSRRLLGSTGSRLLTGDTNYAQNLENKLAHWHNRPAALLCNSGYDANLAVLSCFSFRTRVIMDELCHNSIQMGVRLGKDCSIRKFSHNNLLDLERVLIEERAGMELVKPTIIVVESIYSMDGDVAPLKEILQIAERYRSCVIVDEAHSLGVFGTNGMGLLAEEGLERHPALLCSVHTFGKAAGCHGAVVVGSLNLKQYLYNYGRPIVYSTSLPLHSLVSISSSYESMRDEVGTNLRKRLHDNVALFRRCMSCLMATLDKSVSLVKSKSAIQAIIIPGNQLCVKFCNTVWRTSLERIRLYPIRSPTVPKGQERVRIIIHAHNTKDAILDLIRVLDTTFFSTGFKLKNRRPDRRTTGLMSRL